MSQVELKNVSFVYGAGEPYEIRALDNINLTLGGPVMTGFMGHTGSGKSTLVQYIFIKLNNYFTSSKSTSVTSWSPPLLPPCCWPALGFAC